MALIENRCDQTGIGALKMGSRLPKDVKKDSKGVLMLNWGKLKSNISHRPTQTHTNIIFSSGDIARGKTVCPELNAAAVYSGLKNNF